MCTFTVVKITGTQRITLISGAAMLTIFIAALVFMRGQSTDPRLASPDQYLKETISPCSPSFLSPELIPFLPQSGSMSVPTREESLTALSSPSSFLKLHRMRHFATVAIGRGEQSSPLLDHLLTSPLWILSDIGPWGWVFKPAGSAKPWEMPDKASWEKAWPRPSDRSFALIRTAANLAAIHRDKEVHQLLSWAEALRKNPSLVLSTRASIAASGSRWDEASILAGKALKLDHANTAASMVLIRSLVETGRPDEALGYSRDLVRRQPDDPGVLLLAARTANAAGSSEEEINALERLLAISRKNHQPVAVTISYLGQAYAKSGRRGDALRCFVSALADPSLDDREKRVIREIINHIAPESPGETLQ